MFTGVKNPPFAILIVGSMSKGSVLVDIKVNYHSKLVYK